MAQVRPSHSVQFGAAEKNARGDIRSRDAKTWLACRPAWGKVGVHVEKRSGMVPENYLCNLMYIDVPSSA